MFLDELDEQFLEPEVDSGSFLHHRHHKFNYLVVFELQDETDDLVQPFASQPAIQNILNYRTQQFLQFP